MQGIIFVTWEKYLAERFGMLLLHDYRKAIGETAATSPLASRVYDDAVLLAGVGAAQSLTNLPVDTLLREFGHYFMINGLTGHLCAYLLTQVQSGRDLLLKMHSAHAQMRRTADALTPPLFGYEIVSSDPSAFVLTYDSPRQLCSVLLGAIEGAADRYKEHVDVVERSCMKQGAASCRFEVRFTKLIVEELKYETPEQQARRSSQQRLDYLVLATLPHQDGLSLAELQDVLQRRYGRNPNQLRPSTLLESLKRLHHAGLVSSTANQPGDNLSDRHYWCAPTSGK